MAKGITTTMDIGELQAHLRRIRNPRQAVVRASNRAVTSGRAVAARMVARNIGSAVRAVKDRFDVSRATAARPVAAIMGEARRLPLVWFRAKGREPSRGLPGGVRATLPTGAGHYPRAFIARSRKNGYRGVYARPAQATRYPIVQLRGPSPWHVGVMLVPVIGPQVRDTYAKNLTHEITYQLRRASAQESE